MPEVSIIVPVFNTEKYLCQCLDSIIAQTFTDFETILVDDGSTDESGRICDEYAAIDNRFVVIHKQNEGVAKARITAFEHCRGELITFIDSDDYVSHDYLIKMFNILDDEKCDFVCCFERVVYEEQIRDARRTIPPGIYEDEEISEIISKYALFDKGIRQAGIPLYLWAKLFRKAILTNILNEDDDLWYGEDMVAVLKILFKSNKIGIINERLYYYVQYENQVTRRFRPDYWEAYCKVWERCISIDANKLLERQLPYRMWEFALGLCRTAKKHIANEHEFTSYVTNLYNTPIFRQYVFKDTSIFDIYGRFKDRLKYYLLKYRMYSIYVWLMK